MKEYYLLESPHFKEQAPRITLEEANNDFFIPEYLKNCAKNEKQSIKVNEGMEDKVLQMKEEKYPKVRKIKFDGNKLTDLNTIF